MTIDSGANGFRKGISLHHEVNHWETPQVSCASGGQANRGGPRSDELLLTGQARDVCTRLDPPTSPDGPTSSPERRSLNPRFVEWLMGWPPGWTNFACSETAFIRWRARMRSELMRLGLPREAPPVQRDLFG